jgi:hypothetical protein
MAPRVGVLDIFGIARFLDREFPRIDGYRIQTGNMGNGFQMSIHKNDQLLAAAEVDRLPIVPELTSFCEVARMREKELGV